MPFSFPGSMDIFLSSMTSPKYSTLALLNSHLVGFKNRSFSCNRTKTLFRIFCQSCFVWCKDKNVVHVNDENSSINHVHKDLIHHGLVNCTCQRTLQFVQKPLVCFEGCFPLVTIAYTNIVVSNIQLGEQSGSLAFVQ